ERFGGGRFVSGEGGVIHEDLLQGGEGEGRPPSRDPPLADRHFDARVQMADHLLRRHASPLGPAVGRQLSEPVGDLAARRALPQRLHGTSPSAIRRLQHVTAPSAFASSLTSTGATRKPAAARRPAVRGNAEGTTTRSVSRRTFAPDGSAGSTAMRSNAPNADSSIHAGLISIRPSAASVTADFKCRQPRTASSHTT